MPLTTSELQTLRNDILVIRPNILFRGQSLLDWWNAGSNSTLADFYNQPASPVDLLWRPDVRTQDLIDTLVGSEYVAGATAADVARRSLLDLITRTAVIDTTKAQVRQNFALAAGATTQSTWVGIAQRNATFFEQLMAGPPQSGAKVSTRYGYRLNSMDIADARAVA